MSKVLQLEEFFLTKLHVDFYPAESPAPGERAEAPAELAIDYEVQRHPLKDGVFALVLKVVSRPKDEASPSGYGIDTEILGVFSFPGGVPEDDMQTLIRVNGATILYGILRGEIASCTGSFPAGKFTLPTVYMPDIVAQVEQEKALAARKRKAKPATRRKKRKIKK